MDRWKNRGSLHDVSLLNLIRRPKQNNTEQNSDCAVKLIWLPGTCKKNNASIKPAEYQDQKSKHHPRDVQKAACKACCTGDWRQLGGVRLYRPRMIKKSPQVHPPLKRIQETNVSATLQTKKKQKRVWNHDHQKQYFGGFLRAFCWMAVGVQLALGC